MKIVANMKQVKTKRRDILTVVTAVDHEELQGAHNGSNSHSADSDGEMKILAALNLPQVGVEVAHHAGQTAGIGHLQRIKYNKSGQKKREKSVQDETRDERKEAEAWKASTIKV